MKSAKIVRVKEKLRLVELADRVIGMGIHRNCSKGPEGEDQEWEIWKFTGPQMEAPR